MTFSIESFVFVGVVFLIFYTIRRRARAYFLLAASIAFIAYLDRNSCFWVLATSVLVYIWGLIEGSFAKKNKTLARLFMVVGVMSCVFSLFVLKHVAKWNFSDNIFRELIMPIGFSYYIFQAIAYIVDIYRGKMSAEKNLLFFMLYMCFFPKFVSGPIESPEKLLSQIKSLHKVYLDEDNRLSIAFPTILYGFFMKTVVADRLAMYTPKLLGYPHIYGSQWLFAGMLMYTLQIYCDFAGYSAIAVGVSRVLGIRLTENFNAPYLSPDIATFWRRWHISLSSWLKEYIYIPLGGNRKGFVRKLLNTMIVFLICGLWHGAGLSFIIWGLLHGIYSVAGAILSSRNIKPNRILGTVITFLCVAFAWIFFGAPSTKFALSFITRMLRFSTGEIPLPTQTIELGVKPFDRNIFVYAFVVFFMDLFMTKMKIPFGEALQKIPPIVRYLIEYALILAIVLLGIYGPGYDAADYMYMDF
ncbi:MBOAT family O-acyltransferase [Butyrivibrio sp. FCS014]|uniref:MBOAT family O-acyltransferase n=1 Tax=Butyrivibrio sp. FCS014 TaxID=1408304 RepID=UPI000465DA85|nr:MBOAT family O-acyltransferase [Butyrivibrio sp. FCS014]